MTDERLTQLENRVESMERKNSKLGSNVRQALLMLLDVLERYWSFAPTTAQIRKMWREHYRNPERSAGDEGTIR